MPRFWLIIPAVHLLCVPLCSGSSLFGVPVAEVRFDPALSQDILASAERALHVQVGAPLDPRALRSSIQGLFRTGRYADVQADAVETPVGVRVTFFTKPAWFIGAVRVAGVQRPPTEGHLVSATKLRLGELFTDEKLAEASRAVRQLLADDGFREARIEPLLERDPDSQQVHVTLQVTAGPRARIGGLLVGGANPPLDSSRIREIAGWPRGAVFRRSRLRQGIDRLRKHLSDRDYWGADIRVEAAEYDRADNEVILVARIATGPRMIVRLEGASMRRRRLREYLPILGRGTVDSDLLALGGENLRNLYQSRGFLEAEVEYDIERTKADAIVIVYRLARGRQQRLRDVEIRGNRAFEDAAIRDRIQIKPGGAGPGGLVFSQRLLDADLQEIRRLYRERGYREATVTGSLVSGSGHAAVRIDIEEGTATVVGSLVTSGFEEFPGGEEALEFASAPGQPFSEASVTADQRRVLQAYYDAGYLNVRFDWRAEPGESPDSVHLFYEVDPGSPVRVARTILSGSRRTQAEVLRRRIELAPGSALSQDRMFGTQRNLYDLGVFSKVDVAVQNPDGVETAKNVLLRVDEARRWAVGGGGGAEFASIGRNTAELTNPAGDATFSPRVTLEVTRLNVRGKAHTMGFRTRLSLLQQRGLFTYEAPRWFASDRWRMTITGLYDTFRNVNTFTGRRLEGAFQLTQQLSRASTVLYRYAYRRTSIDEQTLHIEPLLVPLISQPVRVGLMASTYIWDRRDNPTDTTSGMYNTLNVSLASKFWGAQPNFARLLAQNSTYHRVRPRVVFARTVQLGVSVPWAGRALLEEQGLGSELRPDPRIPLSERFFGGGANSHRGFAFNQAGPRDPATGFPLGGGSQFLNSLELRFPLVGADFSGVLFHDAGNVYSRPGRINFRPSQAVRTRNEGSQEFDFDYMVHAVGLGIRYRTPIGPVRLDLAYSPNPPRFVGFDGTREQLLTGTGGFREQRISSFQFHFSLGQTF